MVLLVFVVVVGLSLTGVAVFLQLNRNPGSPLKHFATEQELSQYLVQNRQGSHERLALADTFSTNPGSEGPTAAPGEFQWASGLGSEKASPEFSGTNIQVAGVDEADIVKTDGEYLYLVSGGDVAILDARPPAQASVVSRIETDSWSTELYLVGDRLVTLSHGYRYYPMEGDLVKGEPACTACRLDFPEVYPYQTFLRVYDVVHPASPVLLGSMNFTGWSAGSRLIGEYVYLLVTEYLWVKENETVMPMVTVNQEDLTLAAADIGYFDDGSYGTTLLTVIAIDVQDPGEWAQESFLIGGVNSLYVSASNLYVTATVYDERDNGGRTAIHRIAIDSGNVVYEASGSVPGWVLNQFSMDEYQGYLRLATSEGWGAESRNAVYVLDSQLQLVGRLEDLAPGERIYSARFMGPRGYLVTFRQIDPFFVLDLSNPEKPSVLGELKIPGVSTYLHPYDPTHVLGLGSTSCDEETPNALGCVKLSLFDVSDVKNPKEVATFVIASKGGSYSEAQYDHRALLLSTTRNLLVLPVQTWSWTVSADPGEEPVKNESWTRYYYSGWSGAYVFRISPEDGFELRKSITHASENSSTPGVWYYGPSVRRSLYIEQDLYTISDRLVKIHGLASLDEIKAVPI